MQSLKDKLLKAGLVTEEAAKKAEAEKKAAPPRREDRPPREARSFEPRSERAFEASRLPKFAPLPGSKEAHRQMAKKQLEADKALRERVMATQVAKEPGATPFHFVTRKNKLRRLELSEAQAKALESGALAVVERPDPDQIEHALVPAEVAKELLAAFPRAVRFLNSKDAAVGFLSETEISSRAHEAQSGETGEAHDEPEEEPSTEAPAAQETSGETWITVKRAPKPELP